LETQAKRQGSALNNWRSGGAATIQRPVVALEESKESVEMEIDEVADPPIT
jgi:hypothetical protein